MTHFLQIWLVVFGVAVWFAASVGLISTGIISHKGWPFGLGVFVFLTGIAAFLSSLPY